LDSPGQAAPATCPLAAEFHAFIGVAQQLQQRLGAADVANTGRMPQTDYLPTKQSDLAFWARSFSEQISADPAVFGVSPADAVILSTRVVAFRNTLAIATRPSTSTRPAVAAKDDARERMTQTIRSVGRIVRANPDMTTGMLISLGLIGGAPRARRHPVLQQQPVLGITRFQSRAVILRLHDVSTPTRRAKPVDVAGAILFTHVAQDGDDANVAPPPVEQWRFCGIACRHQFRVEYSQDDVGKRAWIKAAWFTRTGEIGDYSNAVSATIAA
jgi:hypothetical protein